MITQEMIMAEVERKRGETSVRAFARKLGITEAWYYRLRNGEVGLQDKSWRALHKEFPEMRDMLESYLLGKTGTTPDSDFHLDVWLPAARSTAQNETRFGNGRFFKGANVIKKKGEDKEVYKQRVKEAAAIDAAYRNEVSVILSKHPLPVEKPDGPLDGYAIQFYFYMTSAHFNQKDADNMIKGVQDLVAKHYGFNDRRIYKYQAEKFLADRDCVRIILDRYTGQKVILLDQIA